MGLNKRLISSEAETAFTNTDNFAPVTYTGNRLVRNISTGFAPDFVWIKNRPQVDPHMLFDSVRGATKFLQSSASDAEGTSSTSLTSFNSDSFTLGNYDGRTNEATIGYIAWCWKGGGTAVSNTDGSITSQVSANTAAGFSIVSYTGTGSNANFGHGLDSNPELTIIKNLDDGTRDWIVHPSSQGNDKYLTLNSSSAINTSSIRIQSVSSTVVNIGTNTEVNANGQDFICYNFHSVDGYQKIDTYTGTGSSGNSVTTGFQPRFVIIKSISSASNWLMVDNERGDNRLLANGNNTDAAFTGVSFQSTGFTLESVSYNDSGQTFIYLAIA